MTIVAHSVTLEIGAHRVLDNVSMSLRTGELTILLGPNGAGKSSLLSCLVGERLPTAGHVTLDDILLSDIAARTRAISIGYLPQTADVHWAIDTRALVELGRLPYRGLFGGLSDRDTAAVDAALARTDTSHFAGRSVATLSGGERARVLLARVLAGEPRWILVDEPLTHLDPAHQLDVLMLLQQAARSGAGVCMVLHDLSLAARFGDRLVLMHHGGVVADGNAGRVLTPQNLAEVYQIRADIRCDADGVSITPLTRV